MPQSHWLELISRYFTICELYNKIESLEDELNDYKPGSKLHRVYLCDIRGAKKDYELFHLETEKWLIENRIAVLEWTNSHKRKCKKHRAYKFFELGSKFIQPEVGYEFPFDHERVWREFRNLYYLCHGILDIGEYLINNGEQDHDEYSIRMNKANAKYNKTIIELKEWAGKNSDLILEWVENNPECKRDLAYEYFKLGSK